MVVAVPSRPTVLMPSRQASRPPKLLHLQVRCPCGFWLTRLSSLQERSLERMAVLQLALCCVLDKLHADPSKQYRLCSNQCANQQYRTIGWLHQQYKTIG
jgi:hypothetical protein